VPDVTSLYPYINKTGKIPIGHPQIVTEGFTDIQQYEGLIKCKILPPRGLYIPVLPVKMNNKLLFPLCRTCSENQQQKPCQHNDEERSLKGTWVTDELKKALEKGYVVQRIYEVWQFDETEQYDPKTKTGGLFTDYVVLHRVNNNLLFIFTGNTGMYSPLGGRILNSMSPSYCCMSVNPSVMISGCPMDFLPVLLIYGYWEVTSTSDLSLTF
jgi:hypothetical protein